MPHALALPRAPLSWALCWVALSACDPAPPTAADAPPQPAQTLPDAAPPAPAPQPTPDQGPPLGASPAASAPRVVASMGAAALTATVKGAHVTTTPAPAPDVVPSLASLGCPADGALLLAADQPWHLPDLGVTLHTPSGWQVVASDGQGWRLRSVPPAPLFTLSLAARPDGARALTNATARDLEALVEGWQRRRHVVERVAALPARWGGGWALRLRGPSNQPVRALYLPHPAWSGAALLLTLEGEAGALSQTLDTPTRALLEGLSFAPPTVERVDGGGLRHRASGVTVQPPPPKPSPDPSPDPNAPPPPQTPRPLLLPTAPPAAAAAAGRMAWLDLSAPCPLWAQLDVQALVNEPPPEAPAALERLTRQVLGAALAARPGAAVGPLVSGRLGSLPALRFGARLTSADAPFAPPLPLPPLDAPQPWSLLGVVVVRADAPPVLLRAWALAPDPRAAEDAFTRWLNLVTVAD